MWMHNGNIGGFSKVPIGGAASVMWLVQIRRPLLAVMQDRAYDAVPSFHSDSAVAFGLFLHFLPNDDQKLSPDVLLKTMEQTISTVTKFNKEYDIKEVSLLNFVVSDGSTIVATRYVYPETGRPASLYYAEGAGAR